MSPDALLAAFEALADAPNSIGKLRALVLRLAVRGRLVPQDSHDGNASELLVDRVVESEDSATNRSLPKGWAWSNLHLLGRVIGGGTPRKSNPAFWGGAIPWISPKDMKRDFIGESFEYITDAAVEGSSVKRIPSGALLMVVRGMILAHSFPTALTTIETTINQDMKALVPFDSRLAPYLLVLTKGSKRRVLDLVARSTHGTCKLPTHELFGLSVPIPPLAEQGRIVARVDELMALIDHLEAAKEARDVTRSQLRDAALAALQDAHDAEEVKTAWSRIADHMHDLLLDPGDVPPLRQTILQLAVRGLLVPQKTADEPAIELVGRIAAEKARLVEERVLRRSNALPRNADEERRFDLPGSWEWVQADDLCLQITDGAHHTPTYVGDGVAFLSVKDISAGRIDFSHCRHISPEEHVALCKRCEPELGDVLLTKVGTTGIAVEVDTDRAFSIFVSVALLKLLPKTVFPRFLVHLLNSPLVKGQSAEGTEGVGNKNLVLRKIRAFAVPLPPYDEQRRIAAKVDELMALLDRLETHLRLGRSTHESFCASAVRAFPTVTSRDAEGSAPSVG